MNLQARLYDPVIGRFLSVDPLAELQIGITPYHYCGNDPVNARDRSGLLPSSSPGNSGHYGGYSGLNDPDLPSKKGYSDIDIPWDWNWHNFAYIGIDGNSVYSDYSYKTIGGMVLYDGLSFSSLYIADNQGAKLFSNWSDLNSRVKGLLKECLALIGEKSVASLIDVNKPIKVNMFDSFDNLLEYAKLHGLNSSRNGEYPSSILGSVTSNKSDGNIMSFELNLSYEMFKTDVFRDYAITYELNGKNNNTVMNPYIVTLHEMGHIFYKSEVGPMSRGTLVQNVLI